MTRPHGTKYSSSFHKKKTQAVKRKCSVLPDPPRGQFGATSQSARGPSDHQERPRTPFTSCSLKRGFYFPHHKLINWNVFSQTVLLESYTKTWPSAYARKVNYVVGGTDKQVSVLPSAPKPAGPPQSEPDTQETDTSLLLVFLNVNRSLVFLT